MNVLGVITHFIQIMAVVCGCRHSMAHYLANEQSSVSKISIELQY